VSPRHLTGSGFGLDRGDELKRRKSTAALLCAYHRDGDRRARTRVIEENLPLVHSLARRFSGTAEPIDDLVQVGTIGLIKAVDGYREDRGNDLGAYAVPTIVGELRRHVRERRWPVRVPLDRERRAPAPVAAPLDEQLPDVDSARELENSEDRALLRAGLRHLSRRERRVVALRFYGDWSQQRIAAEVGLSQVQVSRVLASSLSKLRDALEGT
jgi:RNA polymerase sigma-B factor